MILLLILYAFTSFLTIYISIKYNIPLWKIFLLSITPFLIYLPFSTYSIFISYPMPISWFQDTLYIHFKEIIIPMYEAYFIPYTLSATGILFIYKKYLFPSFKILFITFVLFLFFTFFYIVLLSTLFDISFIELIFNTHLLNNYRFDTLLFGDILKNIFIKFFLLNIFYYIFIFYYFKKYK